MRAIDVTRAIIRANTLALPVVAAAAMLPILPIWLLVTESTFASLPTSASAALLLILLIATPPLALAAAAILSIVTSGRDARNAAAGEPHSVHKAKVLAKLNVLMGMLVVSWTALDAAFNSSRFLSRLEWSMVSMAAGVIGGSIGAVSFYRCWRMQRHGY